MIDARQVVKHDAKPRLELLPELPRARHCSGGVVQDVADEMQPSDFARYGRAIDEQRGDDDVADLFRNVKM